MKKISILTILTIFLLAGISIAEEKAPVVDTNIYEEGITFEVKTIPLEHQGPNVVDVKVHFDYQSDLKEKEYPDFEPLQPMAAKFLQSYPNNGDYWEVVVKNLCKAYLEKVPSIASVAIELQVYPTKTVAYYHVIHCTASRSE